MQSVIYVFSSLERFTDRCRRVYFATEEPSEGTFMIVNAGLASLFFEAGFNAEEPASRARFEACRDMCTRNLEVTLAQLNLMMPATLENVEALAISVSSHFCVARSSIQLRDMPLFRLFVLFDHVPFGEPGSMPFEAGW